jgi:hypothetical protein
MRSRRWVSAVALVMAALTMSAQSPLPRNRPQANAEGGTIAWQTTFDASKCAERWQCDGTDPAGCGAPSYSLRKPWDNAALCGGDGAITAHGMFFSPGHRRGGEIRAYANMTNGGGGYGYRHWVGDGFDRQSGGVKIDLTQIGLAAYTEIWARGYFRYSAGFVWTPGPGPGFTKEIYGLNGTANPYVVGFKYGNQVQFWVNGGCRTDACNGTSHGWTDTMGGAVGDGLWHCLEWHIKQGTTTRNGVREVKIDGKMVLQDRASNTGTTGTWNGFVIGSNQNDPFNDRADDGLINGSQEGYRDYDDFAVSYTGWIGCPY